MMKICQAALLMVKGLIIGDRDVLIYFGLKILAEDEPITAPRICQTLDGIR